MAGTIGIKIANGDFFPITEENLPGKKRIILTTVHDRQSSVQIDLYRSISKSMLDAQYIGSVVVENIKHKTRGEPSIEMVLSSDENGNISADAYDLDDSSEHHTLNVSLKTMDTTLKEDDFPDFDLEEKEPLETIRKYSNVKESNDDDRKFPWLIMGIATIFVIIAIVILWFFFLGGKEIFQISGTFPFIQRRPVYELAYSAAPEIQPFESAVPQPALPQAVYIIEEPVIEAPAAEPLFNEIFPEEVTVITIPQADTAVVSVIPVPEVPVIKAPVSPPPARKEPVKRVRPPAPVSSYKVPAVIPKNGVVYQICWGDTLWDISEAFYRNPWLYPRIAKHNHIQNPDFIISGFNVRIPPKE